MKLVERTKFRNLTIVSHLRYDAYADNVHRKLIFYYFNARKLMCELLKFHIHMAYLYPEYNIVLPSEKKNLKL